MGCYVSVFQGSQKLLQELDELADQLDSSLGGVAPPASLQCCMIQSKTSKGLLPLPSASDIEILLQTFGGTIGVLRDAVSKLCSAPEQSLELLENLCLDKPSEAAAGQILTLLAQLTTFNLQMQGSLSMLEEIDKMVREMQAPTGTPTRQEWVSVTVAIGKLCRFYAVAFQGSEVWARKVDTLADALPKNIIS